MSWIFFALAAVVLWTIVNILDKYIVIHELRDPILLATIFCLATSALFFGYSIIVSEVAYDWLIIVTGVLSGVIYSFGVWLYYWAMRREEVSRFVSILALEPLVVAVCAYFLFAEKFGALNYLGILLIVCGAILISRDKQAIGKKMILIAVAAMVLFSVRNLLFEYMTSRASLAQVLFWFGLGGLFLPTVLLIRHHPHLRLKMRLGLRHVICGAVLAAVGLWAFAKAVALGPVALVTAIIGTKPAFVFLAAVAFSYFYPKSVAESIQRDALLIKTASIVLIIAGGALILLKLE